MKDELNILNSLLAQAKKGFCRIPVLIAGEYQERSQLAEKFLDQFEQKTTIWVSGQTQPAFSKPTKLKANNVIGKEYQLIIYDIEYNFEPNLFAALSGTLCGGGLMLVLSPPVKNWIIEQQKQANWFTWRFIKILSTSPRCPNITTGSIRTESPHFLRDQRPSASKHPLLAQQALAIQKIVQVVRGHRNRPLVLLADRGRGKSAALGIAASQLLASGVQNILLTSPSMEACTIVFKHLKLNLASASFPKGQVITNNAALRFISPDSLVKTLPSTNLLLVDEAAGIPTATLALITQKYARIVFASTIHGYEGSGHCFSIKFFEHLDRLTPNWKKFELTSPVRWAQADPLEALSNQLFLFSSQEKQEPDTAHKISNPAIQQISAENLVKNEGLLNQLYALLSSAHYRTQPSDLLHLLNDANIVIFLMQENKQLIAAAFATSEGCLEQDIGKQIYLGNRRLKGNIIPQTLATHLGIENAVQHRYLRIIRIAVQPQHQNTGLGTRLVKQVLTFAKKQHCSLVGCVFSATEQTIRFWGKAGFSMVRLGHHQKANSAGYAALMLKRLSPEGSELLTTAKEHFQSSFLLQLKESHAELDYHIVLSIFRNIPLSPATRLTSKDWKDLASYTKGNRQFEDNLSAIHKLAKLSFSLPDTFKQLTERQSGMLIAKIFQQRNWQETVEIFHLSGKKECQQLMKETLRLLTE